MVPISHAVSNKSVSRTSASDEGALDVCSAVRQLRLMLFRLIKSTSAAVLQPRGARADDYDRGRCLLAIADKNTRRKAAFFSDRSV